MCIQNLQDLPCIYLTRFEDLKIHSCGNYLNENCSCETIVSSMASSSKSNEDVRRYVSSMEEKRKIMEPILVLGASKPVTKTADEFEIVYDPNNDPYKKWRSNLILQFFVSREIARYMDRRTFIAVSFREALIFSIFMILLTIITLGSMPTEKFYLKETMGNLYTKRKFPASCSKEAKENLKKNSYSPLMINFYQITTLEHIVCYQLFIIDHLYRTFWYTKHDHRTIIESTEEYAYENKMIGAPQFRQIRVKNVPCEIDEYLENNSTMEYLEKVICFPPYTTNNELTTTIPTESIHSVKMAQHLQWTPANVSRSMSISGQLATYGGGGYVALVPRNHFAAQQLVESLTTIEWYGRSTRAIFIEFTVYNGNANLFCIFKLIFEIATTGVVIPSHWNYVKKLIRYNDTFDYCILACEIVCTILFIFFTIQKALEIKTLKIKLFKSFWNYIDLIFLIMCYLTLIYNILLYVTVQTTVPDLVIQYEKFRYASFDYVLHLHILYSHCLAILIGFAFLRFLKYLNIIYVLHQLQTAVWRAKNYFLSYSILFFYPYFVFALVGVYLFGNKSEDFITFPIALYSLLRLSIGDFDYNKLVEAYPLFGPTFCFLFIFFMSFILLGIFLAILVTSYVEIRSEVCIGGATTYIADILKDWFLQLLERLDCQWILSQIQRKEIENKIRSPTEAIRHYLREAGYSELEIELFFKKYDITDSRIKAVSEERSSFKSGGREAPPPLNQKDILRYIVIQKLEYLENHYKNASTLINQFLNKLTKIEQNARRFSST